MFEGKEESSNFSRLENVETNNLLRTDKVVNMLYMFSDSDVRNIDFSKFNTSKVTDMSYMFSDIPIYDNFDISSFDTSNVTNMSHMFFSCLLKDSFNISKLNTSKVTDMSYMFSSSIAHIQDVDFLNNFDTSNVTNMEGMFYQGSSAGAILKTIDVSSFDTSNVTNMGSMFFGHPFSLTTIYVSDKWSINKVTKSDQMFGINMKLVGGSGTKFSSSKINASMANYQTGYLTLKK